NAERVIALLDRVDDDAERHDVGQLLEADILLLHLAPDRVWRFFAARELGPNAAGFERFAQLAQDARHHVAATILEEGKARPDALARIGIELAERQVLELVLHFVHADALGERRVDLHRFARDAPALVGILDEAQRAHVVQPV